MNVTGYVVKDLSIDFMFEDGRTLTAAGGKAYAYNSGGIEFFRSTTLFDGKSTVAAYRPEGQNPKLRLREDCNKDGFIAYWKAALEYYQKEIGSMSGAMSRNDLSFLYNFLETYLKFALDGRRTKVGTLS